MKKIISVLLTTVLLLTACTTPNPPPAPSLPPENPSSIPQQQEVESVVLQIGALKGPTAMGMAEMIAEKNPAYQFTLAGSPDELVGKIIGGELNIAAVPTNLAATLYNKTEGKVKIAAINTLGVLYLIEKGNTISSIDDLKGKTIYLTGKGSIPEFALTHILTENGLTVGVDVFLEYKTEHAELATLLASDQAEIALLPQPFITSAMMQNDQLRIALDLNEEWEKIAEGQLAMGALLVNQQFLTDHPDLFKDFMTRYEESVDFITNPDHLQTASAQIEEAGILKASVAEKALPYCRIVLITGDELMPTVSPLLGTLFTADPKSIGGKLPANDFYVAVS